jgi:endonuclease YncB( thermonuclease family)
MKRSFNHATRAFFALTLSLLAACGGGGSDSASTAAACTGSACSLTSSSQATSATVATASSTTLCGVDVGPKLLEGLVTAVHDGDTITLTSGGTASKIRLDSIDAPELAQPFGSTSQAALSGAVLGKAVKVTYTKTDQYDRIVGAVFTDSCQYVNLNQVAKGMAWFYKAYQCEVTAAVRTQFSQAQDSAAAADLGLWAQVNPEAPWFYRNGSEPVTPVCSSAAAVTPASAALTATGPTTAANSTTPVTVVTATTTSTVICYTGPRGGTYTLNANGTKNYSGC